MHRPGERVVLFYIAFEELLVPSEERDYRFCLDRVWSPFLRAAGLSANIAHGSWHVETGPHPRVLGWVWRQEGNERLGSVTKEELIQLTELLLARDSCVTGFDVTEQEMTEQFGKPRNKRKLCLKKGRFSIEPSE